MNDSVDNPSLWWKLRKYIQVTIDGKPHQCDVSNPINASATIWRHHQRNGYFLKRRLPHQRLLFTCHFYGALLSPSLLWNPFQIFNAYITLPSQTLKPFLRNPFIFKTFFIVFIFFTQTCLQIFTKMAPRVIYAYNPPPGVDRAPNTPPAPILVVANNVDVVSNFPNQPTNEVLQDFPGFLGSCRLRYALADIPTLFYPKQVCEFYYTCTYHPSPWSAIGPCPGSSTSRPRNGRCLF